MPSVEEIESVWDVPEAPVEPTQPIVEDCDDAKHYRQLKAQYDLDKTAYDEEARNYARKLEVLLWWTDKYCPGVVQLAFWGTDHRPYYLMTDLKLVPGDPSREPKMLVTSTSEAFAMTLFKNCRNRWINNYEWKATHKDCDSDPPKWDKDDESTHKYYSLWSSSRTGSAEGQGWSVEAFDYMAERGAAIRQARINDQANGNRVGLLAKALIREENNIGEDGLPNNSRKRAARAVRETAPVRKSIRITIVDE